MDSEDSLSNLRVASFSYYLKPNNQENFVQKIEDPAENPRSSIIPDDTSFSLSSVRINSSPFKPSYSINNPQESFAFKVQGPTMDAKPPLISPRTRRTDVERLKPFGADKYFNMNLEHTARMKPDKKSKSYSRQETSSVCPKASTWSSGIAILHCFPQNTSQKKPARAQRRRFFTFSCTGACFDSEDVYVKEDSKSARTQLNSSQVYQSKSKIGDSFAFPLQSCEKPSQRFTLKMLNDEKEEELHNPSM